MSTSTASAVATSTRLARVKTDDRSGGWNKVTQSYHIHTRVQFRPIDYSRLKLRVQFSPDGMRPIIKQATRMHLASSICAVALNARCAAVATLPKTKRPPTITHAPAKEGITTPHLDNGGAGFPPHDDGGGGGGGGGGNWRGGFFFFGFLVFLSFLKDQESEGDYKENRRPRPQWL